MAEEQKKRSKRKRRQGVVLKDKMDKGVVVRVERRLPHPRYRKVIKRGKKYYVHDENNVAQVGDTVAIVESRPISKLKRWRLVGIVRKAQISSEEQTDSGEE
jgi:small subunit ribosomal protein S17